MLGRPLGGRDHFWFCDGGYWHHSVCGLMESAWALGVGGVDGRECKNCLRGMQNALDRRRKRLTRHNERGGTIK